MRNRSIKTSQFKCNARANEFDTSTFKHTSTSFTLNFNSIKVNAFKFIST